VIDEGFDAVIRTGDHADSRLMKRTLGYYCRVIIGSPDYFRDAGIPKQPQDLATHPCLIYRFATTGKLDKWPLSDGGKPVHVELLNSAVMNTLDPQICFAENGLGLACVPDLAVRNQLQSGRLVSVLDDYLPTKTQISVMWPTSKHLSPKLRAFVDFAAEHLP
jgi:DNA-binding transcriptional LysR family regulator